MDKNKNKIKYTDISNLNLVNNISYSNIYTHNENNNANYNQFENQKENYYLNNIIINQNNVFDNKNKYFYPNKTEIFPKILLIITSKIEMMTLMRHQIYQLKFHL